MKTIIYMAVALFAVAGNARAEIGASDVDRLSQAAVVARESRPLIPDTYWNRARCVAVVPNLKKAAFIVGGEYGKGVMSCRSGDGWSAPVFLQLARGSWGFQAGAEEVDLVMLVMNESGVQKLLRNNISLGADASVAAGPVGRQANAGTDASLTAEILAYSRAKGLFAGVNLSGGVLRPRTHAVRSGVRRGREFGPCVSFSNPLPENKSVVAVQHDTYIWLATRFPTHRRARPSPKRSLRKHELQERIPRLRSHRSPDSPRSRRALGCRRPRAGRRGGCHRPRLQAPRRFARPRPRSRARPPRDRVRRLPQAIGAAVLIAIASRASLLLLLGALDSGR